MLRNRLSFVTAGKRFKCGAAAAKALASYLAASSPVRCSVTGLDQYGRSVADCFRADGGSVSASGDKDADGPGTQAEGDDDKQV